jgi:hypothetical protein
MSSRSNSIWWVIIIVLLLFVVIIGLSEIKKGNVETDDHELARRREKEDKLLEELEELEKKHEIHEKHRSLMEFTDEFLEKLSERRYVQFVRWGLLSVVIINCLIAILIPAITLLDLIGWYGIFVLAFDIIATLIFIKISKVKEQIKDYIKLFIDGKIYGNRDNKYYKEKIDYYENELVRIKSAIFNKKSELEKFRNERDIGKSKHTPHYLKEKFKI